MRFVSQDDLGFLESVWRQSGHGFNVDFEWGSNLAKLAVRNIYAAMYVGG